jgi:hypothetical protein
MFLFLNLLGSRPLPCKTHVLCTFKSWGNLIEHQCTYIPQYRMWKTNSFTVTAIRLFKDNFLYNQSRCPYYWMICTHKYIHSLSRLPISCLMMQLVILPILTQYPQHMKINITKYSLTSQGGWIRKFFLTLSLAIRITQIL